MSESTPGYAAAVQGDAIVVVAGAENFLIEKSDNPEVFMQLLSAIGNLKTLEEIKKIIAY